MQIVVEPRWEESEQHPFPDSDAGGDNFSDDELDGSSCCISFISSPSLQFWMLAYGLGLEDEAAFLNYLVVEPQSIQNRVEAI
jgi:hypothetical protein